MALNAACVWEVRAGGADTNGGGFKAGASGTDWSQQDAAQYSVTDGVTAGTTTITSASANFGTDVVGNLIYVQGGTGSITAGWYEITARGSASSITVDRSTGLTAGTGVTLKIGGALASPGLAVAKCASGNTIWVKAGTYSISTTTAGAGGPLQSTTGVALSIRGYASTRGDEGTSPILQCAVGTLTVVKLTGGGYAVGSDVKGVANIAVDANGQTAVVGFEFAASYGCVGGVSRCTATSCATGFLAGAGTAIFVACRAVSCTTGFSIPASQGGYCVACVASGGTTGFSVVTSASVGLVRCLALGCGGVGFSLDSYGNFTVANCTAHGCTSHGFARLNYAMGVFTDCCATSNGGYGFSGPAGLGLYGCATHANSSGSVSNTPYRDAVTALPASPWRIASSDMRPTLSSRTMWLGSLSAPSLAVGTGCIGATVPPPVVTPRTRAAKGLTT